jgi:hypothetical protein
MTTLNAPVQVSSQLWHGVARLEQRSTDLSLEESVGLSPDSWKIVGMDLGGGECDHGLRVMAVRRNDIMQGDSALGQLAESSGGAIPVTEFLLHGINPYDFLVSVTQIFGLHLRIDELANLPLRVVMHTDLPIGQSINVG